MWGRIVGSTRTVLDSFPGLGFDGVRRIRTPYYSIVDAYKAHSLCEPKV